MEAQFNLPDTTYAFLSSLVADYVGPSDSPDAIDLTRAFDSLDIDWIGNAYTALRECVRRNGRVFVIGNGGSFDNARLIGNQLTRVGVSAGVPGNDRLYRSQSAAPGGFESIFVAALDSEVMGKSDLLFCISGSGNSENILRAIEIGQRRNATVFGLGGRDGGEMRKRIGDDNTLLAVTECMEALEDIHPLAMAVVAELLGEDRDDRDDPHDQSGQGDKARDDRIRDAMATVRRETLDHVSCPEMVSNIARLAERVERTLWNDGRIFILGDSVDYPAVTHMDADWGRGMINQLPARGPERIVYANTNAWMATGNDDGVEYWLVDEFSKARIGTSDVVVVIGAFSGDRPIELCMDHIRSSHIEAFVFGDTGSEVTPDIICDVSSVDLLATIVTHVVSRCVHDHLVAHEGVGWNVSSVNMDPWPEEGQALVRTGLANAKKLDRKDTTALERILRCTGFLPDGKVITWCYGEPFVVDDPAKFGLMRSFY